METDTQGRISACLWLSSPIAHPSVLSRKLQQEPTAFQIKGELKPNGKTLYTNYSWKLEFGTYSDGKTEDAIEHALAFVRERREVMRSLAIEHECSSYISIVAYKSHYHIGLVLSADHIQVLNEAMVGFNVSIYSV